MRKRPWHQSPYVAQWASIGQYAVKAAFKIAIGGSIASSMIKGDGFHNVADVAQAIIVVIAVWLKRQERKDYPFQLRDIESILAGLIGLVLLGTGFSIGSQSALGLLAQAPRLEQTVRGLVPFLPRHEPVHIETRWLLPLVALTSGSVVLSLLTSWFQIHAGRCSGEAAVVADGKETRADAYIECISLIGVILVQRFGWRSAEYLLGLVVMGFVLHTSWDILKQAHDSLLKRSLGEDAEKSLRNAVLAIPGTENVGKLITFRIGRGLAVCIITVETDLGADCYPGLDYALRRALAATLGEIEDVRETEIYLTLQKPPPGNSGRIAYACRFDEGRYTIAALSEATCLLVCDIAHRVVTGVRVVELGVQNGILEAVVQKHVTRLFCGGIIYSTDRSLFSKRKIEVARAFALDPQIELGVPLRSI